MKPQKKKENHSQLSGKFSKSVKKKSANSYGMFTRYHDSQPAKKKKNPTEYAVNRHYRPARDNAI